MLLGLHMEFSSNLAQLNGNTCLLKDCHQVIKKKLIRYTGGNIDKEQLYVEDAQAMSPSVGLANNRKEEEVLKA